MFPVQYTGIRYKRVTADSFDEAVAKVQDDAERFKRFELHLVDSTSAVLAPCLMLTDEELKTWPCWAYGFYGTDGTDWRVHYTNKGRQDIPDYAEEVYPVPKDWITSWRD